MADIRQVANNQTGAVGGIGHSPSPVRAPKPGEPSFKDALSKLGPGISAPSEGLSELTGLKASQTQKSAPLKFSNHAIERMQIRGVRYSPEMMARIENAIDKAASKGSQNTLVLTDESALIVSVNNRTVVTVMDKQNLKENVFTKIDSTVVL